MPTKLRRQNKALKVMQERLAKALAELRPNKKGWAKVRKTLDRHGHSNVAVASVFIAFKKAELILKRPKTKTAHVRALLDEMHLARVPLASCYTILTDLIRNP